MQFYQFAILIMGFLDAESPTEHYYFYSILFYEIMITNKRLKKILPVFWGQGCLFYYFFSPLTPDVLKAPSEILLGHFTFNSGSFHRALSPGCFVQNNSACCGGTTEMYSSH